MVERSKVSDQARQDVERLVAQEAHLDLSQSKARRALFSGNLRRETFLVQA